VLAAVELCIGEPRRFRRLYDCLLRAYLGADRQARWFANAAAAQGNERLRAFLAARLDDVRKSEPAPEWVQTLVSYREILSLDPGGRFAKGLLAGNPAELEEVSRSLHLTGEAWLATEVVRSAKEVAVSKEDAAFRAHIPTLRKVAAEPRFASLRDDVYATLVNRYTAIPGRPIHTDLRDALVAAWRNPWLERNDSAWGGVSPAARKMVAGWLTLHVISQFFEVLSDDPGQDRSRFAFWSQYHERMDAVYIALGSSAYHSSRPDVAKLKRELEGRLLRLQSPNPSLNAFIMFIGSQVVVEFSQYGNSAFRYRRADAPIDGTTDQIPIGQLRRAPLGIRMIHSAARGLTWQQRFAQELGLGSNVLSQHSDATQTASPSFTQIDAFVWEHRLRLENLWPKGGNIWICASNEDPEITRRLKAWGFAYKQGKGWWRA
jgi:hypothetical protein